jgi:hypothetical protein
MSINITMLAPGFVGNTFYNTGATADVADADAVAAISSRIARYTTAPLLSQVASTEALLSSFEGLSSSKKEEFRDALGITGGGGGSNDAGDLTTGILPAARLLTYNTLSPVAAAMGALVVDVTKAQNTKSVTADSTLTFSATPSAGTRFGLRISADATDRTITIPSSYSLARGVAITSFTLAASTTAYLQWEYTGSVYNLVGDPLTASQAALGRIEEIAVAFSDETTAITTGTAKATFRMPFGMTLTSVKASLSTAQTSGSIFTVDLNEAGTSVLSTKLTIDNTEKTSTTAAAAAVISDATLADDAEITVDVDQVGDGTAKGGKIYLKGVRT